MRKTLAINGGKPVREDFLPFHQPRLGKEEQEELIKTLRSGWLTRGPKVEKFEHEFAKYVKSRYAIGLNSCTAALHLALVSLEISKGDEVITTPFTFAATANVIVHVGAIPVFVDIDPTTLNIDVNNIESKITSRTKAILPVHFAGQPCNMDGIMRIAKRHNLVVIEDAAHAIESVYKGKKIGSIGLMTAFSFYATKNITTAEGGMLTTNSEKLMQKVQILSLHGISADAWKRYGREGYKHWDIIYPGYKYNMTDVQASFGLHQLKKIDSFWKVRRRLVKIYDQAFKSFPGILTLKRNSSKNCKDALHLYVIIVQTEQLNADRDRILNAIQAENIGVGVHYRAVHLHPYYQKTFDFKAGSYPNAEYASDRVISLPLYPAMKKKDIYDVIVAVKKVIGALKR